MALENPISSLSCRPALESSPEAWLYRSSSTKTRAVASSFNAGEVLSRPPPRRYLSEDWNGNLTMEKLLSWEGCSPCGDCC